MLQINKLNHDQMRCPLDFIMVEATRVKANLRINKVSWFRAMKWPYFTKLNIDVNYRVNTDCSQHYSRPNSDIAQFYVPVSVTATACIQTCIILIMLFKCYKTQYTVITLLSGLLWKSKQLHKWTSTFRRCQINGKECLSEEIYRQGGQEKQ